MARKKAKKAKAKTPRKVARTVTRKAQKRALKKPVRKAAKARPALKALKTKASTKKATRKVVKKAVRKPVVKRRAKAVPKPKSAARRAVKAPPKKATKASKPKAMPKPRAKASPQKKSALPPVPTRLLRERKRLPEVELEDQFVGTGDDARLLRSARSGHDEEQSEHNKRNVPGVELTAGDVDANWEDAYAVGDEAPGGDSPTPDQDRVDDIGKALGVQYDDDEELMGGAEIEKRDANRWELDPKSKNEDEI